MPLLCLAYLGDKRFSLFPLTFKTIATTLVSLGLLLGFLASTQSTVIAMITIIRSRGILYAKLKQTEKAKIDLQQAAIIFRQQNNIAADEKVMQLLWELGR